MDIKTGTLLSISKAGEVEESYLVSTIDFLIGKSIDCDIRIPESVENEVNHYCVIKSSNNNAIVYGLNGVDIFVNDELVPEQGKILHEWNIIRVLNNVYKWQPNEKQKIRSRSIPLEEKPAVNEFRKYSEIIITGNEVPEAKVGSDSKPEVVEKTEIPTTPKSVNIPYKSSSSEINRSKEFRNEMKRLVSISVKKKDNRRSRTLTCETFKTKLPFGDSDETKVSNVSKTPTNKKTVKSKLKKSVTLSPFHLLNTIPTGSECDKSNLESFNKSSSKPVESLSVDELTNFEEMKSKPFHSTPKPTTEMRKQSDDTESISSSVDFNFEISANMDSSNLINFSAENSSGIKTNISSARKSLVKCKNQSAFQEKIFQSNNVPKLEEVGLLEVTNTDSKINLSVVKRDANKSTLDKCHSLICESENRRNTRGRSSILRKTFEENLNENDNENKNLTTPEKTPEVHSKSSVFQELSTEMETKLDSKICKTSKSEFASVSDDNETCESSFIDKYKMCNIVRSNSITVAKCARNLSYISPPENNRSQEFMDSMVSTPKKAESVIDSSEISSLMSPTKELSFDESAAGDSEILKKRRSTGFTPFVGTPSNVYRTNRKISTPYNGSKLNRTSTDFDSDKSKRISGRNSTPFKIDKTRKSSIKDSVSLHPPILEDSCLELKATFESESELPSDSKFQFVTVRRRRFGENSFADENKILEESEIRSDCSTFEDVSSFTDSYNNVSSTPFSVGVAVNSTQEDNESDEMRKVRNANLKSILTPISHHVLISKDRSAKKVTFDLPQSPKSTDESQDCSEMIEEERFTMISSKPDSSHELNAESDLTTDYSTNASFESDIAEDSLVTGSFSSKDSTNACFDSPKSENSINMSGVEQLMKTSISVRASLMDVSGVEQIQSSPLKILDDRLKKIPSRNSQESSLLDIHENLHSNKKRKKSLNFSKVLSSNNSTPSSIKKSKRSTKSINCREIQNIEEPDKLEENVSVKEIVQGVNYAETEPESIHDREITHVVDAENVIVEDEIEQIGSSSIVKIKDANDNEDDKMEVDDIKEQENITETKETLNECAVVNEVAKVNSDDEFETSDQYESVFSEDELENRSTKMSSKDDSFNFSKTQILKTSLNDFSEVSDKKLEIDETNENPIHNEKSEKPESMDECTPEKNGAISTPLLNRSVKVSSSSVRRCKRSLRIHKVSIVSSALDPVRSHDCSLVENIAATNSIGVAPESIEPRLLFNDVIKELKEKLKKKEAEEDDEELARKLDDYDEDEKEIESMGEENLAIKLSDEECNLSTEETPMNGTFVIDSSKETTEKVNVEESLQKDSENVEVQQLDITRNVDEIHPECGNISTVEYDSMEIHSLVKSQKNIADGVNLKQIQENCETTSQEIFADNSDSSISEKCIFTASPEKERIQNNVSITSLKNKSISDSESRVTHTNEVRKSQCQFVSESEEILTDDDESISGLEISLGTNASGTMNNQSEVIASQEMLTDDESMSTLKSLSEMHTDVATNSKTTSYIESQELITDDESISILEHSSELNEKEEIIKDQTISVSRESSVQICTESVEQNSILVDKSQANVDNHGTSLQFISEVSSPCITAKSQDVCNISAVIKASDESQCFQQKSSNNLISEMVDTNLSQVVKAGESEEDFERSGQLIEPIISSEALTSKSPLKKQRNGIAEDLLSQTESKHVDDLPKISEPGEIIVESVDEVSRNSILKDRIGRRKSEISVCKVLLQRSPCHDNEKKQPKRNLRTRKNNQVEVTEKKLVDRGKREVQIKSKRLAAKKKFDDLLESNDIQNDKENVFSLLEVLDKSQKRKRKLSPAENITVVSQPEDVKKEKSKSRKLKDLEYVEPPSVENIPTHQPKDKIKTAKKETTRKKKSQEEEECKRCSVILPVLDPEVISSPVKVGESGELTVFKKLEVPKKTRNSKKEKITDKKVEIKISPRVTRQKQMKKVHFSEVLSLDDPKKRVRKSKTEIHEVEPKRTRGRSNRAITETEEKKKLVTDDVEITEVGPKRKEVTSKEKLNSFEQVKNVNIRVTRRCTATVINIDCDLRNKEDKTNTKKSVERTRGKKTIVEPIIEIEPIKKLRRTSRKTKNDLETIQPTEGGSHSSSVEKKITTHIPKKRKTEKALESDSDTNVKNTRRRKQEVEMDVETVVVETKKTLRSTRNNGINSNSSNKENIFEEKSPKKNKKNVVTKAKTISKDLKRRGRVSLTLKTTLKRGTSPMEPAGGRMTRSRSRRV